MVLHDGARAALDGQDAGYRADDVLGGAPLGELAGQAHSDHLGRLELPGQAGHDVHRVCPTHADCTGAQATSIGRVRVRANHQAAREGVVLQNDLHGGACSHP